VASGNADHAVDVAARRHAMSHVQKRRKPIAAARRIAAKTIAASNVAAEVATAAVAAEGAAAIAAVATTTMEVTQTAAPRTRR